MLQHLLGLRKMPVKIDVCSRLSVLTLTTFNLTAGISLIQDDTCSQGADCTEATVGDAQLALLQYVYAQICRSKLQSGTHSCVYSVTDRTCRHSVGCYQLFRRMTHAVLK